MLIDFEKAFDSVSWKFLYSALRFFGFKEDFIKWVQIFNTDINAYILQCGFLSEAITIGRGCRQGDPISPYLFLIVAEFLTLLIENNEDIKGVEIGKYSFEIAQFADDYYHTGWHSTFTTGNSKCVRNIWFYVWTKNEF